ncbi:MAG: DEAD/DEAH box helicase [Vulcanimicrobiaceae bacterium]
MNPFVISRRIESRYKAYLRSQFRAADPTLRLAFDRALEDERLLVREPFVSLAAPFAPGAPLDELGVSPVVAERFSACAFGGYPPYRHQSEAYRRIRHGISTIVATGTGSGKTEAFLLPIVDDAYARRNDPGPKAILLYPMNALALDQNKRLRELCCGLGVTFGVYTGVTDRGTQKERPAEAPAEERVFRNEFETAPPDLFLTNYQMLEYLLLRGDGRRIFGNHSVRYIVLDEMHTYRGALGSDVAALLRRLRIALGATSTVEPDLVFVGTSATLQRGIDGDDDPRRSIALFFEQLAGVPLAAENVLGEEPARHLDDDAGRHLPPPPQLDAGELVDFDPTSADAVSRLGRRLCGAPEGVDGAAAFAQSALPAVLRKIITRPLSLSEVVAEIKARPERSETPDEDVANEVQAALLVGPALPAAGPQLLPRVHRFVRGMPQFFRCASSECGGLSATELSRCPICEGIMLPLVMCNACRHDFLVGPKPADGADETRYYFRLDAADLERELADATLGVGAEGDEDADGSEDADGADGADHSTAPGSAGGDDDTVAGDVDEALVRIEEKNPLHYLCDSCGSVSREPEWEHCAQPRLDERQVYVRVGNANTCPVCLSRYTRGPQLRSVKLGNSPALAWIARTLMEALPERDRRLLVFCDSRQDASHQARYIKGSETEIGAKREILRAVEAHADPSDFEGLSERLVPRLEAIGVLTREVTSEGKKRNRRKALGQLLREFVFNANRRDSLERFGLVRIRYAGLDEALSSAGFVGLAADHGVDRQKLAERVPLFLDALRFAGGAHLEKVAEHEDPLRERLYAGSEGELGSLTALYGLKVSRNTGKPIAFTEPNEKGETNRDWVIRVSYSRLRGGPLRELLSDFKELAREKRLELAHDLFRWLVKERYLRAVSVGRKSKRRHGYSVPLDIIEIVRAGSAAECTVCRRRLADPGEVKRCPKPACDGYLIAAVDSDDAERDLLTEHDSVRLIPEEHSAAVDGAQRDEIERRFQLQPPEVNVLACTPTLELGVNIGALEAVAMRNVPPNPANYAQRAGRTGRRSRMGIVTTFAMQRRHDAYYFDHPEEMIAGAIPAPRFNVKNLECFARHVHSVALETAKLDYARNVGAFMDDEGELDAVALQTLRTTIESAGPGARRRAAAAFAGIEGADEKWIAARVDETAELVERAIEKRSEAIKYAAIKMHELDAVDESRQRERRQWQDLARGLRLGDEHDQQAYLPRILAESGVLPGYAFPSDPGSLTLGFEPQPLRADRVQAQREYAPGQVVYARGQRWQVTGLALFRPDLAADAGAKQAEFVVCETCGQANRREANTCARHGCGAALGGHVATYLDVGAFRAVARDVDPLSEEERKREFIDQRGHPQCDVARASFTLGRDAADSLHFELSHGESILFINHGRLKQGKTLAEPYRLCLRCGASFEPPQAAPPPRSKRNKSNAVLAPREPEYSETEIKHRTPEVCGGEVHDYALGHPIRADILRMHLPSAMAAGPDGTRWAWSIAMAIVAGAIRAYDIDEDDLEPLVVMSRDAAGKELPVEVLWIDRIVGGSGVIDLIAREFSRVAKAALQHLGGHDCERSCYRCLRTYRTAWRGDVLDWRSTIGFLRNAAELDLAPGPPAAACGSFEHDAEWERARAEGCDSPAELRLLEALRAADVQEPEKQYRIDRSPGHVLTVADFAWPEQRLLVYVDGLAFHNTRRQRIHDARQQRALQDLGWRVSRFLGAEVYGDAQRCVHDIERALAATMPMQPVG